MKIIIGGKKSRACASISDEYIDRKKVKYSNGLITWGRKGKNEKDDNG